MLRLLHIENIAVIEQADILFERGFNVMTGDLRHSRRARLPRYDPHRRGARRCSRHF